MKRFFYLLIVALLFGACRSDEEPTPAVVRHRNVVFISSLGGPGDNGYNDLLMEAEVAFVTEHPEIEAHYLQPKSLEGVMAIMRGFCYMENCDSLLFVLNGSEYAGFYMDQQELDSIAANGGPSDIHILQFEGRADEHATTTSFCVQRYGASYIAGRLASGVPALVLAALKGDEQVDAAVQGFLDGYSVESTFTPLVHYLADDVRGFDMPDAAMQVCDSVVRHVFPNIDFYGKVIPIQFPGFCIFPVAGGSNIGAYRYVSALPHELMINAIGMDKDYCSFSGAIPFSITVPIRELVLEHLNKWVRNEPWPQQQSYGMEADLHADIVLSSLPGINILHWIDPEDNILPVQSTLINKRLQEFCQEAIQKEKEYEEKLILRK